MLVISNCIYKQLLRSVTWQSEVDSYMWLKGHCKKEKYVALALKDIRIL